MTAHVTCHLSGEQREMLRGMLEQQRRFRVDQLSELAALEGSMGIDEPAGRAARRRSAGELEVRRVLTNGARAALADVCSAISRMDAGTYGACVHCGRQLPLERLEVLPHAALCMQCQRVQDALR